MRSLGLKWQCSLGALWLGLAAANASATAVASADIRLNWDSLVISADPGLTLTPDPVFNGRYANTAYLGVSQASVLGSAVPSADLAPYNLSYQPITSALSVQYTAGNAISRVAADLTNGPAQARLQDTASDRDGNVLDGHFVNAYVGRNARYYISGSGSLNVSIDYTMLLGATGTPGADYADVYATVTLGLQDYVESSTPGLFDYVGTTSDNFNTRISFSGADASFTRSATLSVSLPFDGTATHLVLMDVNAFGIPFANAYADDGQPVPEPGALPLALAGLGLAGAMARRRRA